MVYNPENIWLHLYEGYILKLKSKRNKSLSTPEAFKLITDGKE